MRFKEILFLCVILTLLAGSVCAAKNVNDFKVDNSYKGAYSDAYHSLYLNDNQNAGVIIFKNVDDDAYGDKDNDAYDHLIHDDGREYIVADDDFKLEKGSDYICTFTDYDHAEHGAVEVVDAGGEQFIVVFWAKDSNNVNNSDLLSQVNQFNKDNNLKPVAF